MFIYTFIDFFYRALAYAMHAECDIVMASPSISPSDQCCYCV